MKSFVQKKKVIFEVGKSNEKIKEDLVKKIKYERNVTISFLSK